MKEIRQKESQKSAGATNMKSGLASKMRQGLIRSKDTSRELSYDDRYESPDAYAQEKVKDISENAAGDSIQVVKGTAGKTYDGGKRLVQLIKQKKRTGEDIKQTAKSTGKASFKTVDKNIKCAGRTVEKGTGAIERSARVKIKTAEKAAAGTVQKAKKAKKASRNAAKKAKKAADNARKAAKKTAKAVVYTVKAIVKGIKKLVVLIAAGGWVAVVVIIIIVVIALIVASGFGLFYSGGGNSSGEISMTDAISEIDAEYTGKLDEIKESNEFDLLEMSGSRAVWREVLTVYSVKVAGDPDNPQETATMDEGKLQELKDVFWSMNEIDYRTETKEVEVVEEKDDGHGNITVETTQETKTVLYITISHRSAEEMASEYGFTDLQRTQLNEMLSDENKGLWEQFLQEVNASDDDIVSIAYSQIGNTGGETYWSWYGFPSRVEWCACFVSWCADRCGYIDSGVIPKFAGCQIAVDWFDDRGQWRDNRYVPRPGDIIFFDWEFNGVTGTADHVGIVQKVENNTVFTLEGNSSDSVAQRDYPVGYDEILGYGVPLY